MAEPAWMLDTNALSELIRNPGGPMVQRLAAEAEVAGQISAAPVAKPARKARKPAI